MQKKTCLYLTILSLFVVTHDVRSADYTPGKFHNYSHAEGTVPKANYQYSVYVPNNYDPKKSYPVVVYLHGGGRGRFHPDQGKRNMISDRLKDNKLTTDAGYSRNVSDFIGYILVSPVKPVAKWNATAFKRLLARVKSLVSINENRVYVNGIRKGGQGKRRIR